jgi:fibronectin-binding autotransporter adhesin
MSITAHAANTPETYTGSTTGELDSTGVWSQGFVPTVSNDALFNGSTVYSGLTLNAGPVTFGSLNDTDSGAVTISASQALTLGGSGDLGDSVSGSNSADLLYVASGSTLNYSGTGGIALGQTGNFDIVGTATIGSAMSGSTFGINMTGGGNLTLAGATVYTGNTTVSSGTLNLNFSATGAPATNIINNTANSSALVMGGGTLLLTGNASTTNSQQFNGTTFNAGGSAITLTANATANPLKLSLGAITHNTGGTVVFTLPNETTTTPFGQATTNGILTSTGVTNSLLGNGGGWAIVYNNSTAASNGTANGYTYATDSGTSPNLIIAPYTAATAESSNTSAWGGIVSGGSGTVNYDISAAFAAGSSETGLGRNINTIRYTGSGLAQESNGTGFILETNGILNAGTGLFAIGGGTFGLGIQIGANDELVLAAETAGITINNSIENNGATGGSALTGGTTGGTASALTIMGAGGNAVTLAGADTYTGFTTVASGTLQLGVANAIPGTAVSTVTVASGATLNMAGFSDTIDGLAGTGTVNNTLASSTPTLTIGNEGSGGAFSGVIENTAGILALTKTGAGVETLSGANSYSGATSVTAGTLSITGSNSGGGSYSVSAGGNLTIGSNAGTVSASTVTLANSGTTTVNLNGGVLLVGTSVSTTGFNANTALNFNGGTLKSNAAITVSGGLPINILSGGATIDSSGGNITFSSGLAYATGSGNLTIQGGNTVTVSDTAANESGNLTVTGSGTKWTLNSASGTTSAGLLTINTGATVDMSANTFTTGGLTGAGTLTDSGTSKVFSITGSASNSFSGNITGSTALTVNTTGAGTQTLSGNNSYSGTTTINAGTLILGNALAAQNSALTVSSTNGLAFNNTLSGGSTYTIGSLAGASTFALTDVNSNNVALSVGGDNTGTTYSGAMTGGGSLTKTGTGTLTLSSVNGSSAYTGSTTVSGGGTLTLDFNDNGGANAGTPAYTVNGSTLNVHQNAVVSTALTNPLGTGTLTMAGSSYSESEAGSSGNAQQTFGNLTLNPGASNFFISATRGSSSGFSTGFNAVTRNAGGLVDFEIGSFGSYGAFGGSFQQYAVNSGSTVLGYLTYGGNDWLAPASNLTNGFQVYAGYSNDLFASGDNSNVTLTTDTVTANTPTNTIRFNTAVAGVVTISNGVTLTVSHGGILMGSTVGTNSSTITGGSITSGNTNGDGSHDLILINNDTTASGGNLVIASSIVNPSVGTIGITAGQTVPGTVPGQIQLGGTNTFSCVGSA